MDEVCKMQDPVCHGHFLDVDGDLGECDVVGDSGMVRVVCLSILFDSGDGGDFREMCVRGRWRSSLFVSMGALRTTCAKLLKVCLVRLFVVQ